MRHIGGEASSYLSLEKGGGLPSTPKGGRQKQVAMIPSPLNLRKHGETHHHQRAESGTGSEVQTIYRSEFRDPVNDKRRSRAVVLERHPLTLGAATS